VLASASFPSLNFSLVYDAEHGVWSLAGPERNRIDWITPLLFAFCLPWTTKANRLGTRKRVDCMDWVDEKARNG
jgi:hypothetical protein